MTRTDYTAGPLARGMLRFAGPFLLSSLLQNLYGSVDLLVVGQFATTADVSAVTIGSQVMGMVTQLVLGFATGISVLLGRFYGAKNEEGLSRTVGTGTALFAGFAVALTAVVLALCGPVVGWMKTPAEAVEATYSYLTICAVGLVFIVGFNLISSMLTGLGNTKTPFLFVAVACAINIVLDIVLVRGYGMGAAGAAWATVAAQAGSVLFSLVYLRRNGLGFRFLRAHARPKLRRVVDILKIGAPVAVQNAMIGVSFLFITSVINTMGVSASAAVGVVEKLIGILMMPAIAFGAAVATIAAQNLGARQPQRAGESLWVGVRLGLVPSLIATVFCQFGGGLLAALFSADAEVVALAASYLQSYSVDVLLVAFIFSMNGYFNAAGYSWFTLLHSLLTTFLCRMPLCYLLSRVAGGGLYLVGWAAPVSTLVSLGMCLVFLRYLRRRQAAAQSGKAV